MATKLNDKLWNGDELKDEVKGKLFEIALFFYDILKIDAPIRDIILTGSLANYNYHKTSDIDLHIILDFGELPCDKEFASEYLMAKKELFNSQRNITVKGFDVELYPQDINQEHQSSGQYSILNNEWVVKPKPIKPLEKDKDVLKLSNIYKELIGSVNSVKDDELKIDLAKTIKKDIIKKRKDGLKDEGEQSVGNKLFKKLRKDDFYKLLDAMNGATDRKLSLENRRP